MKRQVALKKVHQAIELCRACPKMVGTPVHGPAIESPILLAGQAPGPHESSLGRPFAYTAGKTLFKWFAEATGVQEEDSRDKVYIAAVARCFPGKSSNSRGDREPDATEIRNCSRHLKTEIEILKPQLLIAVG